METGPTYVPTELEAIDVDLQENFDEASNSLIGVFLGSGTTSAGAISMGIQAERFGNWVTSLSTKADAMQRVVEFTHNGLPFVASFAVAIGGQLVLNRMSYNRGWYDNKEVKLEEEREALVQKQALAESAPIDPAFASIDGFRADLV